MNKESKNLKEGGERIVPLYNEPKNTPFVSSERREIYNRSKAKLKKDEEKSLKTDRIGLDPVVKFEMYSPPKEEKQKYIDPNQFLPTIIGPSANYCNFQQPQPIIYKKYNLNVGLPSSYGSGLANEIIEDLLPIHNVSLDSTTISGRIMLQNYIKSTLFDRGDGADINLSGKGTHSLFSRIKLMDINPYNSYRISKNIYEGMPKGLIIYRSCYPIRRESVTSTVSCAADSTGVNVRIYKLEEFDYEITKQGTEKLYQSDIWREIAYYEYIREQIIKENKCPNFVILFGFYIAKNSGIKFEEFEVSDRNKKYIKFGETEKKETFNLFDKKLLTQEVVYKKSAKALVSLTEAPTYNLFNWASKTYQIDGNIKKQISTGFYSDSVWYSVLFQIMVIFYVLQKNHIKFNNFKIEDNIFIKDLKIAGNVTKYWKYKINKIDYYVPNMGYLVLFDSNFKEPEITSVVFKENKSCFKIQGKIFNDTISEQELSDAIFEQFKNTFSSNIFSTSFLDCGGNKPPTGVLKLLNKMMNDYTKSKDVQYYILNNMKKYLNNRIGTVLNESEIGNIILNSKLLERGDIVVYTYANDKYMFALYLEQVGNNGAKIMLKEPNGNELYEKEVEISLLSPYSKFETIKQNFNMDTANLNENELLETYILD